jgi:hypothetical protein
VKAEPLSFWHWTQWQTAYTIVSSFRLLCKRYRGGLTVCFGSPVKENLSLLQMQLPVKEAIVKSKNIIFPVDCSCEGIDVSE